ncbi:tachykinin-like peptides receptor 99D [Copidosoma floridanum]|uniref:tachykinin-like peptides receptor 99D n=1 Tax=Copidosoma floridanum TaxID=29053 RepID=UPI0006C96A2E|nr:tachykinin-like peptides receptor 99D [Copidosoma floridanum]
MNGSRDFSTHENYSSGWDDTEEEMYSNKFRLPLWRQLFWTFLFAIMIIVSTGGNLIVIWIVLTHKRMRTVTNYFLVNLSVADTMVSTLNVIFNYVYMLNSHWPFGNVYCKVSQYIAVISISASVFTLMAISIDRYVAIVNPLKPRMGKRMTLCVVIAIWVVSALISLPMLFFYETATQNFTNGEIRIVCYQAWPDQNPEDGHSVEEYWYNVVFMILTYFMPITAMSWTYFRIARELWGSQSIGEATQRQQENIRNKRRVVKMMIVVVLIFTVCWLPFHAYFIVTSILPEVTDKAYIQEVYLGIYWLAMSNSMYNPIIYCWMNSRFRQGFAQFFSWLPWVRVRQIPALSRSEAVNSRYSYAGSPEIRGRLSRNGTILRQMHMQPTFAETTTTLAPSRRDSCEQSHVENGSRRLPGPAHRHRLPYTATRFQKLGAQPDDFGPVS